jgi:serine/threonine protein kinase
VVVVFALPLLFVMAVLAFLWKRRVTKMADVIWEIKLNDLVFDDPPQVLGRGTFGVVLAATYNTTRVAVKRVIPSKSEQYRRMDLFGSSSGHLVAGNTTSPFSSVVAGDTTSSFSSTQKTTNTGLQTTMGVKTIAKGRRTLFDRIFPCMYSEYAAQRNKFINEMRFLSKMRHPCITTVMGAVVASDREPMLVMECMEYGSLHDLIHNYTMVLNGELVIPLLVDVCQGLSFLHSSKPPLIHGDLKAGNVLVDSKFRAKPGGAKKCKCHDTQHNDEFAAAQINYLRCC